MFNDRFEIIYYINILEIDAMLADNYTCVARNSGGEDSITYSIKVLLPPNPPTIHVLSPQDSHALKLKLEPPLNNQDTTPPQGIIFIIIQLNSNFITNPTLIMIQDILSTSNVKMMIGKQ